MKKAIGCPPFDSTTLTPMLEASVSNVKGREKSGKSRTRVMVKALFNALKAF